MHNLNYVPGEGMGLVAEEAAGGEGGRKGLGMIVGFVAMIFVPYASPAIAGAIGMSGAIGSAVVGAAMGAGLAAVSGGDPWLGAAGGLVGGFFGGGGMGNLFGGARGVAGVSASSGTGVSPAGTVVDKGAAFAAPTTGPTPAPSGPTPITPTASPGAAPSSITAGLSGGVNSGLANLTGATASVTPGGANSLATLTGAAKPGINLSGATPKANQSTTTGQTSGDMSQRFMQTLASNMMRTGDPYGEEQRAEMLRQMQEAEQRDKALYNLRLDQAQKLLAESEYYKPEEGGRRAAEDVRQRIDSEVDETLRTEAASRGYNTGKRNVLQRQAGLAKGRAAAAGYREGADRYHQMKLATVREALPWLPAGAPNNVNQRLAVGQWAAQEDANKNADRDEWIGYAFGAQPHQPTEQSQWPQDRIGVWGRG